MYIMGPIGYGQMDKRIRMNGLRYELLPVHNPHLSGKLRNRPREAAPRVYHQLRYDTSVELAVLITPLLIHGIRDSEPVE